ncbi:MAG TPA: imidazole glycerol phosphate synthase subunit HisH [Anaerolineae bacterium]|nr:imidazole glycerol phosphate synthase subunit HisH [Anaerolineae bacterium]HQK12939.1 imidazole glycerol phosphate synthase subunit HisH [Anaerolineae bacterium]
MIALIDYGAGNVRSVHKALMAVGADVQVTQEAAVVLAADKVVLPGVGAFGDCMASLARLGLIAPIREVVARGTPFLGICVGMQVLFDEGMEMGQHAGLGLLPGRVVRFDFSSLLSGEGAGVRLKVPHTGWNQVVPVIATPLLADLPDGAWAYFNHGYYCQAQPEHTLAVADYGGTFPCVVGRENVYGIQFHPEKSQHIGLHILRNFVSIVG